MDLKRRRDGKAERATRGHAGEEERARASRRGCRGGRERVAGEARRGWEEEGTLGERPWSLLLRRLVESSRKEERELGRSLQVPQITHVDASSRSTNRPATSSPSSEGGAPSGRRGA